MKQSYYLYKSGRLQRKDNTLEIVYKDNIKKSIPIERVDDIYVMTELDFNTNLLNFVSQFGVNVHFLIIMDFIQEHIILKKLLYQESCYLNKLNIIMIKKKGYILLKLL